MRRQHGFSLFEILVTMLIVSFGLLGIAGILAAGLKTDHSSYARSQASWLANDIIDRMRANRTTAEGAGLPYNLAIGATPSGGTVPAQDLVDWRAALAASLPVGTGGVNVDAATKKVVITVQWNDSRAAGGEVTQQFVVETRL
jgi:type IV pilus assembly protein PilV